MQVSLKLFEILDVAASCPLPGLMPHVLKKAHTTCPAVLKPAGCCSHAIHTGETERKWAWVLGEGLPLHTLPSVILPRK